MDGLLILLSVTAAGGLWLRFIYRYDKVEPEPIWTVLRIGLFGGLTAAVLAVIGNGLFEWITGLGADRKNSFLGSFFLAGFVGISEEICKAAAAVVFLDKLEEMDEPIDALIYSASVGLGFAFIENIIYAFKSGLLNVIVRSVTAMPLHVGLGAVLGIGIAKNKFIVRGNVFTAMGQYIGTAAIVHAGYDFINFYSSSPFLNLLLSTGISLGLMIIVRSRLLLFQNQSPFLKAGDCSHCGFSNPPDSKNCLNCGRDMAQFFFKVCTHCRIKVPLHFEKCPSCDRNLETPPEASAPGKLEIW